MRIKVNGKYYKMREGAQCMYELALGVLGMLALHGLFYKLCELIVFIGKEVR